ncbi:MAG TPA: hypothetical protein VGM14_17855 [Streptosporangiaceae bacterium]|jgi:hypothetical protein
MSRRDHSQQLPPIAARALILSPPATPGAEFLVKTAMMIVLPDGTSFMATPSWKHSWYYGVLRLGAWVPVLVSPGDPDNAELDDSHVPDPREIAAAIGEALGGPPANPCPYDEWRVKLALDYAERLIKEGVFNAEQAEAIRQRIGAGI